MMKQDKRNTWGRAVLGILIGAVVAVPILSAILAFASPRELSAIQAAVEAKSALWRAGESWVTRLSPEDRRRLLGEKTLESGLEFQRAPSTVGGSYPSAIDWRNKDGSNWVTPIRDQQSCGSCVAFGSVATLESLIRIEYNQPGLNVDLSEMHIFNCGGGACLDGWYNPSACEYLINSGTPYESCWAYLPSDSSCSNSCSTWQSQAHKITNYGNISGVEGCKTYVAIAPILVAFNVYKDFYYYTDGIYEYTYGSYEGGHAVSIVGYDTTGPVDYWIVKNSWGSDWGG
jgi:C1A family cysteine protease